jgi:hypothetical protein
LGPRWGDGRDFQQDQPIESKGFLLLFFKKEALPPHTCPEFHQRSGTKRTDDGSPPRHPALAAGTTRPCAEQEELHR